MTDTAALTVADRLKGVLARQRESFYTDGPPSLETRTRRLDRAIAFLIEHRDDIVAAIDADFGHRSAEFSALSDVAGVVQPLKHAKEHLAEWMAPDLRKVSAPLDQFGASARIEYQPLGVVGVVAPWNAPMRLIFHPLANILAAGNRAMIKPSEITPAVSTLLQTEIPQYFDETELAVATGGPEVAAAFVALPFDHLIYTGSTAIGREVMRAAAEHLVPVTLELGGKCPVIIGRGDDAKLTADRVMSGKATNAGQACIAPDHVYVPESARDDYVSAFVASVEAQYPTLRDNTDYTTIINARHYERLREYVDDARAKGAVIVEINPAGETLDDASRIIAPTLILDPTDDMMVMQEEIFGPLLPVTTYRDMADVVAEINARPRPLALYYFGHDPDEEAFVLSRTTSGNVTVNDVIMHTTQDDLPFGGVGASGIGSYRGVDGFRRFSHAKGIFVQSDQDIAGMVGLRPPYDQRIRDLINSQIGS